MARRMYDKKQLIELIEEHGGGGGVSADNFATNQEVVASNDSSTGKVKLNLKQELSNKINNSIQIPIPTLTNKELIGVDENKNQIRIKLDSDTLELIGDTSPYTLRGKQVLYRHYIKLDTDSDIHLQIITPLAESFINKSLQGDNPMNKTIAVKNLTGYFQYYLIPKWNTTSGVEKYFTFIGINIFSSSTDYKTLTEIKIQVNSFNAIDDVVSIIN